uniref:Uncharacterized protein n=1 Tax=Oryza glumipatula TaxID=40148 RepID=A0A0E0AK15_9ORYZ
MCTVTTTATMTILCVLSFTDSLSYLPRVPGQERQQKGEQPQLPLLGRRALPSHPLPSPRSVRGEETAAREDRRGEHGSALAAARGARAWGLGRWSATVSLDLVTIDAARPRGAWLTIQIYKIAITIHKSAIMILRPGNELA